MKSITQVMQNLVKPYIDNKDKAYAANIAPVEVSPAEAAHTAGTQLIYNGVLYDVTADIAINDDLATEGAGANISAADKVTEQISSVNEALSNEIDTIVNDLSAKNLLDIETWLPSVGRTFTKNGDTYATSTGGISYGTPFVFAEKDIDVTLSGIITNDTSGDARVEILNSSNEMVARIRENTTSASGKGCKVRLNWTTDGNFSIEKPMIRPANIRNSDYAPYAMTNRELTDVVTASHSLGSRVNISSYNSSNNKYTCANDGYVYIQIDSDSNCTYLSALLSDGTAATTVYKQTAGSGSGNALVYVPKGMSVYFDCDNASPTKIVCRFIPIV